jgi:hypothetical protein
MNPNVVLPFASSALSLVFAALLLEQWRTRRRAYQLAWAMGMLWYGLSAGTEFLGGALGWSEPLYRAWYLIGAIWVAAWLGLGTVFLLARTRFGYAFAVSLFFAGLFTLLAQEKYHYVGSGIAPAVYFGAAVVLAAAIVVLTARDDPRWSWVAASVVAGGTLVSIALMATVRLAAPGYALDPATGIPTGELYPGYLRLLTPFFNITGAWALGLGALFSAYVFMPKRRLVRYDHGTPAWPLVAAAALPINFLASLPGAVVALVRGRLNSRVPATILIAIGAVVPAITSGANRFGATSAFFVGELLGVVFLFAGFLVSIEVFADLRVPVSGRVLFRRRGELDAPAPALATSAVASSGRRP